MVDVRDGTQDDAMLVAEGQQVTKATKCDLCVDHHGGPACERACPHDALKRVNPAESHVLARWLNR